MTLRRRATGHRPRRELTRFVLRPLVFSHCIGGNVCTVPHLLVVPSVSVRPLKPLSDGISRRALSVASQCHIYGHSMQCPLLNKCLDFHNRIGAITCHRMRIRCIDGGGSGVHRHGVVVSIRLIEAVIWLLPKAVRRPGYPIFCYNYLPSITAFQGCDIQNPNDV